jgi:hypothetical protein
LGEEVVVVIAVVGGKEQETMLLLRDCRRQEWSGVPSSGEEL